VEHNFSSDSAISLDVKHHRRYDSLLAADSVGDALRAARVVMVNQPSTAPDPSASLDVDGMLGRLAKWLRILGFDAAFPRSRPSAGRIFVTARRSVTYAGVIVVSGEDPSDQLRQVLEQAGIRPDPRLLLSRCLICNIPVREVRQEDVAGKVPDGVLQRSRSFHECPECGRIYWEGSHADRIRKRLQNLRSI
jgi:uncharacterized protein with PIN domain